MQTKTARGPAVLCALLAVASGPSHAQQAEVPSDNGSPLGEIVVTARKRTESIMNAPVVVEAITSTQVQDLRIEDMSDLASVTPGLIIGDAFVGVGATVYMRGLGNGNSAQLIDQSVLLNIDGVSMSHGAFYKLGMFDVGQIEVLKGPQALFFGKSSSAGIIAVHSADPTADWESKATVGYEYYGNEKDVDAYVSGPLTDNLGIRVAGYHNVQGGWLYNDNPYTANGRVPGGEYDGARLTLKYDNPQSGLRMSLKLSTMYNYLNVGATGLDQAVCTGSTRQKGGPYGYIDDCRIDNMLDGVADPSPYNPNVNWPASYGNVAAFASGSPSPLFRNGRQYTETRGAEGGFNVDYDVAPGLTVSSVTGVAWVQPASASDAPLGPDGSRADIFGLAGNIAENTYSEELRLTSNWPDKWINFMVGGLYNPTFLYDEVVLPLPAYTLYTDDTSKLTTHNWSGFAQVLLTPVDHWELSVGARYSEVTRFFTSLIFNNNLGNPGEEIQNIPYGERSEHETNTSPELTLSYRPTELMTAFVSYKQGYKAPGFNQATTAYTYAPNSTLIPFGGEKAAGFEGGIKAQLFDRHLSLTAAAYTYNYHGLQVSFVNDDTLQVETTNGADAKVQGIEFGLNYNPPAVSGLVLSAFANYNHAYYTFFPYADCYGGQTIVEGCITTPGGAQQQNLAGHPLTEAPLWTAQVGVDYKFPLTDRYAASLSLHSNISSSYNVIAEQNPNGVQSFYATVDAAVRFGELGGAWEVALIGRDLTNRFIFSGGLDDGDVTPGVRADGLVYVYRPRQVALELTVRPELFFKR